MSFFQSNKKRGAAQRFITVSAETTATVSNRVDLSTQVVQFEADEHSNNVVFASRANTGDYSERNKKGIVLVLDKDTPSGQYSATDPKFPSLYYFETGENENFTASYQYHAKGGSLTLEVVENSTDKLHLELDFDFKGEDSRTEELKITGKSVFIVLFNDK